MQRPPAEDNIQTTSGQATGEVNPNPSLDTEPSVNPTVPDPVEPVVKIQMPEPAESNTAAGDSTGTEQTIQGDPTKPEYDEEKLSDPTKTPDGQKVSEPPENVDHDKVTQPSDPPPRANEPKAGDKKDGMIYVPGFGWIKDEGGGSSGETVGSDGDINKPVGSMGGDD